MLRSGPRLGKHKTDTPDGDFCVDALEDFVSPDPSEHSLVRTTVSRNLSMLEERAKASPLKGNMCPALRRLHLPSWLLGLHGQNPVIFLEYGTAAQSCYLTFLSKVLIPNSSSMPASRACFLQKEG